MIFDICLFKNSSGRLSQYPTLDYARDVIVESLKLTLPLHGKRQFTIIKRRRSGVFRLYQIYNQVYNDKNDSFGICVVYYDYYPYNVDYMFRLCGSTIAKIIEEGKAMHFNFDGNIVSDSHDLGYYYSTLEKYKDKIESALHRLKVNIRPIPHNVYNCYENQHIICQLSDKVWSLENAFKTNNIVVVTEVIEEENIYNMRNLIKNSNETIENLKQQISSLKQTLKRAESQKIKGLENEREAEAQTIEKKNVDWVFEGVIFFGLLYDNIFPCLINEMATWMKISIHSAMAISFGLMFFSYDNKGRYAKFLFNISLSIIYITTWLITVAIFVNKYRIQID